MPHEYFSSIIRNLYNEQLVLEGIPQAHIHNITHKTDLFFTIVIYRVYLDRRNYVKLCKLSKMLDSSLQLMMYLANRTNERTNEREAARRGEGEREKNDEIE